jgi:hypothetical protein
MDYVADVNADSNFNLPLSRGISVAMGKYALNFNRALGRFQRTSEFDHEGVTDRFDLRAVKPRKDFPQ